MWVLVDVTDSKIAVQEASLPYTSPVLKILTVPGQSLQPKASLIDTLKTSQFSVAYPSKASKMSRWDQ